MKLHQIPCRVIEKLSTHAFQLFGYDKTLLLKVKRRNDLKSIGTRYGGWVVPTNLLNADSIFYCVGCGEDISFDLGLIEKFGCEVFGFDPTPRAIEHVKKVAGQNPHYHFFELGLWDKEDTLKFFIPANPKDVSHSLLNLQKTNDYIEVKVKRLQSIMEDNGHKKIDLLKIDIEGAEYKVIESIIEDNINIKILCVEYDECFCSLDRGYKRRIRASVKNLLEAGYSLVCAQGRGNYTFVKDS